MTAFKMLLSLSVLVSGTLAAAAPTRIANCEAERVGGEKLCVHVNDYGDKLKVILKQCGNMNSWETYTVVQNGNILAGTDSKKRPIELRLEANGEIVYAKAINLNMPDGFEEIINLPITCLSPSR